MSTEGNAERAIRWLEQVRQRISNIEPDWWLRMECGQVLEQPEQGGHVSAQVGNAASGSLDYD